jgi:Carboxypeptidase regulatory-like domain
LSSGTITGRVLVQGKPVHEAIVTLWHQVFSRPSQQAVVANARTDAEGAYQLTKVPAGSYYIRATAAGYVIGDEYKNDIMAPPRAVYVDSGEQVKGVDFELMRGGVISGRVTDARGQPVIEQTISLIVEPAPTNSASP